MDYIRQLISGGSEPVRKSKHDRQEISLIDTDSWFGSTIQYDKFMDVYDTMNEELPLTVRIKTNGGKLTTFMPIARVLNNHVGKTTAIVDRYAYSGGTILCLMCDEIIMTKNSILGGINPYIYLPINSNHIKKGSDAFNLAITKVLFEYLTDMESCFLDQFKIFLSKKYKPEEITEIIDFFVYKYDHNLAIYYDMLPEIIKRKVILVNGPKPQQSEYNDEVTSVCDVESNDETGSNDETESDTQPKPNNRVNVDADSFSDEKPIKRIYRHKKVHLTENEPIDAIKKIHEQQ